VHPEPCVTLRTSHGAIGNKTNESLKKTTARSPNLIAFTLRTVHNTPTVIWVLYERRHLPPFQHPPHATIPLYPFPPLPRQISPGPHERIQVPAPTHKRMPFRENWAVSPELLTPRNTDVGASFRVRNPDVRDLTDDWRRGPCDPPTLVGSAVENHALTVRTPDVGITHRKEYRCRRVHYFATLLRKNIQRKDTPSSNHFRKPVSQFQSRRCTYFFIGGND